MGPDAMTFVFWMLSFKPTFSLSTFTFYYYQCFWGYFYVYLHCVMEALCWQFEINTGESVYNMKIGKHYKLEFISLLTV